MSPEDRKQRLLALINSGASFRDAGSPPLVPPPSESKAPEALPIEKVSSKPTESDPFKEPQKEPEALRVEPKVSKPERKMAPRKPVEKISENIETSKTPSNSSEAQDEPPAELPEIVQSVSLNNMGSVPFRERRKGMRSDPAWQQKTIYLKRANIDKAEEISRLMGVDFSVLVDYALGLQILTDTRTPELQKLLDRWNHDDI